MSKIFLQNYNVKGNLQQQLFYFFTFVQYNVPLGRKKNSVNTLSRLFCSSAPALNSDLCRVILTAFYLVYFSPSAFCPCVIACLRLEMGHPSYWTHLGHYFQCSSTYAIHNINIPMISCSHLAEMTLVPQLHEAPNEKNTFWDNSACEVPFLWTESLLHIKSLTRESWGVF